MVRGFKKSNSCVSHASPRELQVCAFNSCQMVRGHVKWKKQNPQLYTSSCAMFVLVLLPWLPLSLRAVESPCQLQQPLQWGPLHTNNTPLMGSMPNSSIHTSHPPFPSQSVAYCTYLLIEMPLFICCHCLCAVQFDRQECYCCYQLSVNASTFPSVFNQMLIFWT